MCVFVFSFLSRLHWSAHIGPRPQSEGRGDLIVHHLGAVERWANIPYGWHGNGLLGSGWTVCQRQFLVVATLLQHPPDLNAEMQRKVCVCVFEANILWRWGFFCCFLVRVCVWLNFGRWNSLRKKTSSGGSNKGNKEGCERFSGRWENEEWEDSRETGGEIKLFFVLYLPQRLKESINLLPLSVGDDNTHTRKHISVPTQTTLSLSFTWILTHMFFLQTRCCCTYSSSDCVRSEVGKKGEEGESRP